MFKLPKDDDKYQWTNHVKDKMLYYGISESLIKRIVRFPKRKELAVAPGTIGAMQSRARNIRVRGQPAKKDEEIWVMYKEVTSKPANNSVGAAFAVALSRPKVMIISAWRYPGTSPVGKTIPIPDEILQELKNLLD